MPFLHLLDRITRVLSRRPGNRRVDATGRPTPSTTQLLEAISELKRGVEELSMLNDLAREIGASTNLQEIMERILRRSLQEVQAEQGVITLVSQDPRDSEKTLVRTSRTSSKNRSFKLDDILMGWVFHNRQALMVNDPPADPRFSGVKWDGTIRSILGVPLLVKSELIGLLTMFNKKGEGGFTEANQRLLAIVAGQSAQVIENARLYEEEKALDRLREDLRLASRIQADLLPQNPPRIPGYDIAGRTVPAQIVGGDYFDFLDLGDRGWAFCLGDVSGKGLPASLLMANLQATLRGQASTTSSIGRCIASSNRMLFHSTASEKFATLFLGILDQKAHSVVFANAGHNYPLLFTEGSDPVRLRARGMMLGFREDVEFEEKTIRLRSGDLLLVYSDGITEARNPSGAEFEEERLIELVKHSRDIPAADLIDSIFTAVNDHTGDQEQTDDMTLVAIRRTD